MRGKPSQRNPASLLDGITPACAGKTTSPSPPSPPRRDHPRVCGENCSTLTPIRAILGSPPRVRGKPNSTAEILNSPGITPACAGKTFMIFAKSISTRDHPRVCGENVNSEGERMSRAGSPPRVRGKPSPFRRSTPDHGITPACAGKTLRKWRISVVGPSPQPQSSLTFRRADASIGSQRAPCAAPV